MKIFVGFCAYLAVILLLSSIVVERSDQIVVRILGAMAVGIVVGMFYEKVGDKK